MVYKKAFVEELIVKFNRVGARATFTPQIQYPSEINPDILGVAPLIARCDKLLEEYKILSSHQNYKLIIETFCNIKITVKNLSGYTIDSLQFEYKELVKNVKPKHTLIMLYRTRT